MGGTQFPQEKYAVWDETEVSRMYQIVEKRTIDDIPTISKPIQNTAVFSPLNIAVSQYYGPENT